jgi:beta-N-acetylhexosaminidase
LASGTGSITSGTAPRTPRVPSPAAAPERPAGARTTASGPGARDGFSSPAADAISAKVARMTQQQKIAAIMMTYGDVHATPASGSVIVNQTHLTATGIPQLRDHLAAAARVQGAPVLVGADQEGGAINRLKNVPGVTGTVFPSAKEMQGMSLEEIRQEGVKTGRALATAGVNMLLGPSLDVADPGTLMDKMNRSFGSTPEDVKQRTQAFVDGLRAANPSLAIISKHYPGYNAKGNSDIARVSDPSTPEQIAQRARPFFEVNGLDGVMMSSVVYPNARGEPACFNKQLIDQLRAKNPSLVVMTDDLMAKSLTPTGSAAEITANAQKAFMAGNDVILSMDSRANRTIATALDALITKHPELQKQLDASVARVLALRMRQAKPPSTFAAT